MFQPCYTPAFAARRSRTPWAPTCLPADGSCWQEPALRDKAERVPAPRSRARLQPGGRGPRQI